MAKALEPRDTDQVALFTADGRAHHRDGFAISWVETKLIEDPRNNHRLCRTRVDDELEWPSGAIQRPPDSAVDDDQIALGLEARDLHGTKISYRGGTSRPVKNEPAS